MNGWAARCRPAEPRARRCWTRFEGLDQGIVDEAEVPRWWPSLRIVGGWPDLEPSSVCVTLHDRRNPVDAEDFDCQVADREGSPIPVDVTSGWPGAVRLSLALEPDEDVVGNLSPTDGDETRERGD